MFSGIGGFENGIESAFKRFNSSIVESDKHKKQPEPGCVGFSEVDKYAISIYQKNFPAHKGFGDATRIIPESIDDFDLLCGGFPCQAFSIAGKRGGFEDTRGTLFHEIARIAKVKRPKLLFLENVKGLLSHDNGRTFGTILATFSELGYFLEWQVLNSKDFRVPQNRERVFIIGHLGNGSGPKVFPISTDSGQVQIRVVGTTKGEDCTRFGERDQVFSEDGIMGCLKSTDYKQPPQIMQLNNPKHSNDRIYDKGGISPALNTMQGGNRQPKIAMAVLTPDRLEKRQNGRRFKEDGEPSFTVTAQDRHGVYDGMRIRRLTPTECERLQGYPDVEKSVTIRICLENQKNYVSAEKKNHKLPSYAGNVGKTESKDVAKFAIKNLNANAQQIEKHAQSDVLISCVERGIELSSQGKCLLNATGAEMKNFCHPAISIEDFVRLLVGITTMSEIITQHGEVGLHQSEQCLTVLSSGKRLVSLYGSEIMQPVENAEKDLTILRKLLKCITSNHFVTKPSEQELTTLSCFAIRAIVGFIPQKILSQNTFTIEIKTKVG